MEPVVVDEARVRSSEDDGTARTHHRIVAVARRRGGRRPSPATACLARPRDELALQDDTLVMPEHRGHRLGLLMKLATLDRVRRDHPERTALHTWTARRQRADAAHQPGSATSPSSGCTRCRRS